MKRWVPALAIFAIAASFAAERWIRVEHGPALADPQPCVPGDADGDGQLNISDPVFLLGYLFLGTEPPVGCRPASGPVSAVILVRHAEKLDGGGDVGLTPEGQERARRLAFVLGNLPVTQLISSDLLRTRATLQPLADAKGMAMEVIVEAPDVVARVLGLPAGSISVVVHHSYTLPDILEGLGVSRTLVDWSGDSYDNILVLLRRDGGEPQPLPLRY